MMKNVMHLKAPGNWINDPNGFIYYKGKYHMFYQYFPYATQWGTMHWGHAISDDLVSWEHLGVALFPTKYEDQNGCFSGGALEYDGRMYLYYTGVRYLAKNPDNIHLCPNDNYESSQMMIVSEDGIYFDNYNNKKVIIPPVVDARVGDRAHTRDPKVWRGKEAWYMILGSTLDRTCGELLFYRSENLQDWILVNQSSKAEDFGWMWECPDYFETDGGKVLIVSSMGLLKGEYTEMGRENQIICTLVEFEEESCKMKIPDEYQFMDYGLDLYAHQSTLDSDGRRVLVAWLRMPDAVCGANEKWWGMFCLPRVVEVQNGHIYFRVHPEVKRRYSKPIQSPLEAHEAGYRLSLNLEEKESVNIGGYRIYRDGNRICTDRSAVFCEDKTSNAWTQFVTPEVKDGFHLDIYVDENMVEVYVNDGEYVISNAVYHLGKEIWLNAAGEMQIYTVQF